MDFSANGRFLIASCEFSGQMIKVDVEHQTLLGASIGTAPRAAGCQDYRRTEASSTWPTCTPGECHADRRGEIPKDRFHPDRQRRARTNTSAVIRNDLYVFQPGRRKHLPHRPSHAKWPGNGNCRAAKSRTWAAFRRMARCCGFPAATIRKSTRSIPKTGTCWRGSRWDKGRTGCACIHNQAGIRWDIRVFCDEARRSGGAARLTLI